MKHLRRVLFFLTLSALVLIVAVTASAILYKDRIIKQFIREANKQLNTPITIKKIDVSVFEDFPQLSIVFHEVYIEDSHPGQYPLLTARKVSFQLNPLQVWQGDYTVKGMELHDSEAHLKISATGDNNYTIAKKEPGGNSAGSTVAFELSNVSLQNTIVHYLDLRVLQDFTFSSNMLKASIHSSKDIYEIEAMGEVTTEKMTIRGNNYLDGKSFNLSSQLIYDDNAKHLTIHPSELKLKTSQFTVAGTYEWKGQNIISLTTTGTDTDIQTLLSLLPESKAKKLDKYRSKGNVYFRCQLNGEISSSMSPSILVDFGFNDATLYHPDYKTRVQNATLKGLFKTKSLNDLTFATLSLQGVTGKLNNENFHADFVLENFNDPNITLNFKGKIEAPAVLDFYPMESVRDASGTLDVDIAFKGKINLLKNKLTAQQVSTLGTVDLQGVNLVYGKNKIALENLNGNLQFNNNDLALSNVSGNLGNSDFVLNGFFKNIVTFLLFENQPIGIETDLKANLIDLNELFAIGFGDPNEGSKTGEYTFNLSKNVNLNFNCDIKSLRYKRFHGQAIHGDLLVKNQMAVSRSLSLKTMGGNLSLSGIVDAKNNKAIDVVSSLKLNGLNIDSVFYVFENFRQTFIENRHLKGRATADVNLEMTLNQHLRLFQETLVADIGISISNGELNNFEPLRKLERYLGDEGLNRLRFSDLKNEIHIENKTIYLPQMEVGSNVTDIKISGTHTFDQRIDYRLITPLRPKRIIEAAAQQATDKDDQGNSRLFLKIFGTTDDYRILYDTEAVKKKIASDLKKEVQELKDAFKSKTKKKEKEVELSQDEYFDW